jgi:N-acetylmuramoyl-L-alanine amidase
VDDIEPLGPGDTGPAVRDLQRRLVAAGHDIPAAEHGVFGPATTLAFQSWQQARGLADDGRCDRPTWLALVESGFRLGDRLLYLRSPMQRGDDVAELQQRLGSLGFDAGRTDGIFGPTTERSLREFQRNCGITTDGVCGPEVLGALARLGPRTGSTWPTASVATVRERLQLRLAPRDLVDRRVVVGETGGLDALATAVGALLQRAGAQVAVLHHPDWSHQARQANEFAADVTLGLELGGAPCFAASYATDRFASEGGRGLAGTITASLTSCGMATSAPRGMRLAVLRETRMPAVFVHLGPPPSIVADTGGVARALAGGIQAWVLDPVEP